MKTNIELNNHYSFNVEYLNVNTIADSRKFTFCFAGKFSSQKINFKGNNPDFFNPECKNKNVLLSII